MRRAPSIAALTFALLACLVLGTSIALEVRATVPDTAPRAAIERAAAERAAERRERFTSQDRSFDAPFAPAMVRDRVEWRAAPGDPPTTDVTIVNATPGADLAASARACAEREGRAAGTRVQCYAFATTEAYEYKNITGDMQLATPTAIVNLCWAVLASNERAGGAIAVSDMRLAAATWEAQGCPDGWAGTGDDAAAAAKEAS